MSRRAIRLMNSVFNDVTAAEMAASNDTVCIICREEMVQAPAQTGGTTEGGESGAATNEGPANLPTITPGSVKRLPCGHIFHTSCLRNWFQRQQTCPTCRMNILRPGAGEQAGGNQRGQRRGGARAGSQQRRRDDHSRGGRGGTAQIRIDIQRTSTDSGTTQQSFQVRLNRNIQFCLCMIF